MLKIPIKFVIKLLLSSRLVLWFYRRLLRRRPRIILYHGISDLDYEKKNSGTIDKDVFQKQIKYLKRYYVNITLSSFISARETGDSLPANGIIITFDDGYENNYRCAVPILRKYGFTASVFINPRYVEMTENKEKVIFWWDIIDYLMEPENSADFISIFEDSGIKLSLSGSFLSFKDKMKELLKVIPLQTQEKIVNEMKSRFADNIATSKFPSLMNWQQLRELKQAGVEVGGHTLSHFAVSMLPPDKFPEELVESKKIIEEKLSNSVEAFAFPYGNRNHYSQAAVQVLKEAGYKCALLVLNRDDEEEKDGFCLNRTAILKEDSCAIFKLKVTGVYEDIQIVYRKLNKFFRRHVS